VIGEKILKYRAPIGIVLLAISAYMAYAAAHITIATRFVDFFPRSHPNVLLYHKYERYGGAQTLTFMIEAKHGDIFTYPTLKKVQDLTFVLDKMPAVNHQSIRSLASYRVTYAIALPGFLKSQPYMYPSVPKTQAGIDDLKREVFVHRRDLRNLVSPDTRSALVTASFYEGELDYRKLFNRAQDLVKQYSDADTNVYVVGEPIIRGYGYYYFPTIVTIFIISVTVMIFILWISLRERSTWWTPIITGSLSALWGLGFVGIMDYTFDPVMLVIPFILTARDMSHGIQWQGRYYNELDRVGHRKFEAIAATTSDMLPPGLLSILADIAGIIFISFGGIPVLQHIALAGSVWLAGSLTMVFIFQPILMSYLPTPQIKRHGESRNPIVIWLKRVVDKLVAFPTTPGATRPIAIGLVFLFILWGIGSGLRAKVGYTTPGTPLYRQNAKVNQDMRHVGDVFPLDEGWVITSAKEPKLIQGQYPSVLDPDILRMQRDLSQFLMLDRNVTQVVSVAGNLMLPFNRMFHYSEPEYASTPSGILDAGSLFYLFAQNTAPGESELWVNDQYDDSIVRIYVTDHTYATLNKLTDRLKEFQDRRQGWDPGMKQVDFKFLGGIAGLYAAANDVLYQLDFINITFVLGVVLLFCCVTYRSLVAGLLFVISCVAANFGAFIYMRLVNIGITIDTIPVISLGIGLGVDYGIYTVSRILDECRAGESLDRAVTTALYGTGAAVFMTFATIVGGMIPWVFSPLLFHNEMSVLLIILMFTNMIVGVLILPAFIAWAQPKFIFGGRQPTPRHEEPLREAAT
jgi:predicted RND superfamily exporter protein